MRIWEVYQNFECVPEYTIMIFIMSKHNVRYFAHHFKETRVQYTSSGLVVYYARKDYEGKIYA